MQHSCYHFHTHTQPPLHTTPTPHTHTSSTYKLTHQDTIPTQPTSNTISYQPNRKKQYTLGPQTNHGHQGTPLIGTLAAVTGGRCRQGAQGPARCMPAWHATSTHHYQHIQTQLFLHVSMDKVTQQWASWPGPADPSLGPPLGRCRERGRQGGQETTR